MAENVSFEYRGISHVETLQPGDTLEAFKARVIAKYQEKPKPVVEVQAEPVAPAIPAAESRRLPGRPRKGS